MTTQTLQELDKLVAEQMAALSNLIDARLVPLLVRKQIAEMAGVSLSPAAPAAVRREPSVDATPDAVAVPKRRGRPPGSKSAKPKLAKPKLVKLQLAKRKASAMKLPRGATAHIILKALSTAPVQGMHGRDLNALILAAGLTIDSAEKSKTHLRHWGILDHDVITGLWSITQAVRTAYPDISVIVPPKPEVSRKGQRDMREFGVGRLVMDVLSKGPTEGTLSAAVYEAVEAHGFSYSSVKKSLNGLRIAGHVTTVSHHHNTAWRIVEPAAPVSWQADDAASEGTAR